MDKKFTDKKVWEIESNLVRFLFAVSLFIFLLPFAIILGAYSGVADNLNLLYFELFMPTLRGEEPLPDE